MTTQEKLERIKAKCRKIIARGEKRTQGRWAISRACVTDIQAAGGDVAKAVIPLGIVYPTAEQYDQRDANASFIAACAGPAEAMARITLVAIELVAGVVDEREYGGGHCCDNEGRGCSACFRAEKTMQDILAAWPEELL